MAKQDQIPTTQYVPKYQNDATKPQLDTWLTAIAAFCNGAQTPKTTDNIKSIRIGSLVFLEGSINIDGVNTIVDILPVSPRNDGFITMCSSDGIIKGVKYTSGNKSVDFSGFDIGNFLITACYLASTKEYI